MHISSSTSEYRSNTALPRLSYLKRAGYQQDINYAGANLKRVEAAVSPDYEYFMVVTVDDNDTAYFSAYYRVEGATATNNRYVKVVNFE